MAEIKWKSKEEADQEQKINEAKQTPEEQIQFLTETVRELLEKDMTEEELLEHINVYPEWLAIEVGTQLPKNKYVKYEDELYRVIQPHPKQTDYTPDVSLSLFVRVVPEGIIPEWEQPGSENTFMIGAKVTWKGKVWTSKIDNNDTVPDGDEPHNRYWKPE